MQIRYRNTLLLALAAMLLAFTGCNEDDDEQLPEVVARFTQTVEVETGTVTFINASENADNYAWDFGDSTTSTEINPIKVYANGTYTVRLTATNVAGGSDTFDDTFTIAIPEQVALPATFDDPNTIYEPSTFGGASFEIVANPDVSGSNNKETQVGAITNIGAAFEGIFFNLGAAVDLTTNKSITMNFWSDVATTVLLKLEEGTAAPIETTADHDGSGWQSITFDFASADSYSRLTMFVDGPGTTAGTFYLDDITQTETIDTTPPVISLIGGASIDLTLGDAFTDPGATATDNVDGDISGNIVVGGDAVDNMTEGAYVITYNVSDAAGNEAAEVTRTVNVTSIPFDDGLLTNGDFQNGADPWTIGVSTNPAPLATEGSNSFYSVDVTTAGNPFDVNLTQQLEIVEGQAYILTFDAWSDRERPILAGIGLSGGSFANTTQTVSLTTTRQTFTLNLTATGFGAADARVLFDNGAAVGVVNIDNVSLVVDNSGGGGGGGANILDFTFSDAASINGWVRMADANEAETSIEWIADGGVEGGALQITGTNPSAAAGKAYIFQLDLDNVDYMGSSNVRLTFDLKLSQPLIAAAVHLQTNIPGVGVVNNFDLQAQQPLNETNFTSYSYDFTGVDPGITTMWIHFNFASGAVENAGGSLLIDNIKLVAN